MTTQWQQTLRAGLQHTHGILAIAWNHNQAFIVIDDKLYHRDLGASVVLRAYRVLGSAVHSITVVPEADTESLLALGLCLEHCDGITAAPSS